MPFAKGGFVKGGMSKDASSADPMLAATVKCRVGQVDEVSASDTLNDTAFKLLSGGDALLVRNLYESFQKVSNLAKFLWNCNYMPKLPADPALMARVYPISCDSVFKKFLTPEDEVTPGVFLAEDFESDPAIVMLALIGYAKNFAAAGFQLPAQPVGTATERAQQAGEWHHFIAWVKDNYVHTKRVGAGGQPMKEADWKRYGAATATSLEDIVAEFKRAQPPASSAKAVPNLAEARGALVILNKESLDNAEFGKRVSKITKDSGATHGCPVAGKEGYYMILKSKQAEIDEKRKEVAEITAERAARGGSGRGDGTVAAGGAELAHD